MHEGTIYPRNDTLTSQYPLANVLTGCTVERREDVLVRPNTGVDYFVLLDTADPTIAPFGSGLVVT